ncbi:hypothetical protein [Erythrobacter crassostreae]|uniref:Uncharacterized protein n=1 Tax=Erythrobacter crassostreae TaxID=2828328 RepID=A0A9X1JKR2_9SPHN|nr:hypothetical protein [Erythrobacter crassostrea]MBV7259226.1 hypothetical protein [Erythrobacter crassostrea]
MLFATIFMMAFVLLGGLVLYLSKTIDHGEARFDSSGKEIKDKPDAADGDAKPAQRLDTNTTPDQVKDNHE